MVGTPRPGTRLRGARRVDLLLPPAPVVAAGNVGVVAAPSQRRPRDWQTCAPDTTSGVNGYELGMKNVEGAVTTTENGNPVMYWVGEDRDGATDIDGVWRGEDLDDSGRFEPWEVTHFYDPPSNTNTGQPGSPKITSDGAVWFSSNKNILRGLWRCVDLNGDHDAMDVGETVQLLDARAVVSGAAMAAMAAMAAVVAVAR